MRRTDIFTATLLSPLCLLLLFACPHAPHRRHLPPPHHPPPPLRERSRPPLPPRPLRDLSPRPRRLPPLSLRRRPLAPAIKGRQRPRPPLLPRVPLALLQVPPIPHPLLLLITPTGISVSNGTTSGPSPAAFATAILIARAFTAPTTWSSPCTPSRVCQNSPKSR